MFNAGQLNSDSLSAELRVYRDSFINEGLKATVEISAPVSANFDLYINPLMKACFRAGFGIDYVVYVSRK